MRPPLRDLLLVLVVGASTLLPGLGATALWDYDETLWAGTAAEMGRRHDWVVPMFNGELSTQKPPFMFWMMLLGTRAWGDTEFSYRIGSALFGLATALVTCRLGDVLFGRPVGLVAGSAVVTAVMFDVVARGATPDAELTFFCTVALLLFAGRGRPEGWPPSPVGGPLAWPTALGMYAAMGAAVLTKGPIGLLLPTAALGLFSLLHRLLHGGAASGTRMSPLMTPLRTLPAVARDLRPLAAVVMVLLVVGPWYGLVQARTDGAFGAGFIGVHNVRRFLEPFERHRGSILYYVPALLLGFFPWSMFTIPTAIDTWRRIRGRLPGRDSALLLAVWIVFWVGFFSLAQTKLPNYIVPVFPAAAILTAAFLVRWMQAPDRDSRLWMTIALGLLVGCGAAAMAACLWLPSLRVGGGTLLERLHLAAPVEGVLRVASLGGAVMIVGGAIAWALAACGRRRDALLAYVAMSAAFALHLFGPTAAEADRHQPTRALVAALRAHGADADAHVGQHRYSFPGLVHYRQGPVEPCRDAAAVAGFFARHPRGFMVVVPEDPDGLTRLLPPATSVVAEVPMFPEAGRAWLVRGAR